MDEWRGPRSRCCGRGRSGGGGRGVGRRRRNQVHGTAARRRRLRGQGRADGPWVMLSRMWPRRGRGSGHRRSGGGHGTAARRVLPPRVSLRGRPWGAASLTRPSREGGAGRCSCGRSHGGREGTSPSADKAARTSVEDIVTDRPADVDEAAGYPRGSSPPRPWGMSSRTWPRRGEERERAPPPRRRPRDGRGISTFVGKSVQDGRERRLCWRGCQGGGEVGGRRCGQDHGTAVGGRCLRG